LPRTAGFLLRPFYSEEIQDPRKVQCPVPHGFLQFVQPPCLCIQCKQRREYLRRLPGRQQRENYEHRRRHYHAANPVRNTVRFLELAAENVFQRGSLPRLPLFCVLIFCRLSLVLLYECAQVAVGVPYCRDHLRGTGGAGSEAPCALLTLCSTL